MELLLRIESVYARLRLLSLDVAAAALGGGVLAIRVIGSSPRRSFYWLLPAGVWVVYTLDHLLDARHTGENALTPRHRFHHDHFRALGLAVVIVSLICAIGGWFGLSTFGLIYAGLMCGLVLVHETIVKLAANRASPMLVKELGVAVVFTVGVWGMPWLRHRLDSGRWFDWPVLLMVQYLLLAFVNLIEFAIYEWKIDTVQGQTSFVRGIGRQRARWIVVGLLTAQLPLSAAALAMYPSTTVRNAETIYTLMSIGLLLVLLLPKWMRTEERYRTVGDGVFLLPLLMAIELFR